MPLPADFLPFLRELKANNDRAWFEANRKRYEANRDAMLQLLVDLAPRVRALSPHTVVDPRPQGGSLMRIFRDVRFSKDKSPYKPAFAAQFWHEAGEEGAAPAFYVRLAPDSSAVGTMAWGRSVSDTVNCNSPSRLNDFTARSPPIKVVSSHPTARQLGSEKPVGIEALSE